MRNIFKDFAPLYWGVGLQAIPLMEGRKNPIPTGWQRWNREPISSDQKAQWLENSPNANVGVCPGPTSNVCFVDLDIEDPELLAKVEAMLPFSPWRRVGAKGCVKAYRWCDVKSFKVFESEDSLNQRKAKTGNDDLKKVGIEFFSTSGQVVMPPSIHPDTHQPYVANCNLWEVMDQLQPIDGEALERQVRELLRSRGIRPEMKGLSRLGDKVSKGTRDTTMVKLAGHFAYAIRKGDLTLKEAMDNMDGWANGLTEGIGTDDGVDVMKGKQRIVEFLVRDVHERNVILPKGWDEGIDEELRAALNLDAISEDNISLDFGDIKQRFEDRAAEIEAMEPSLRSMEYMRTVDNALRQIAKSESISEMEIDTLFGVMQDTVGKSLRMGALRKGLRQYKTEGIKGESHSEVAEEVLRDFQDIEMRFCNGFLWEWCGSYWKKVDKDMMIGHIIKNYGTLPAARRSNDHEGIYKTMCKLVVKPIKTASGYGINFTNGYLGTDMRLVPHDREYGLVYELPYEYRPDLPPPNKFIAFLEKAWPDDPQMPGMVQECLAVTLFGMATRYQRCFLAYGVPHSGKSTLMEIIESLFPYQARIAVPPNKWHEKHITGMFDGPVLNLAGELPEKALINSQIFKQVVNGEPVTGEYKFEDAYTFNPTPANWFASNHLPLTADVSAAFIRRWLILDFKYSVPENERNVRLAEDIVVEEREAIVAWAVSAIHRVIARNSILMAPSCVERLAEMSASLNPIRTWLRESVQIHEGASVPEETAYVAYQNFVLVKGYRRLDRAAFRATMREEAGTGRFNIEVLGDGSVVFHGITIKRT